MDLKLLLFCCAAFSLQRPGEGARILGVFPIPGKSHMIVFSALTKALAERGHELVVVSTFPTKNPPANYTDVNIWDSLKEIYEKTVNENLYDFADMPPYLVPLLYWTEGVEIMRLTLHDPKVMQLLNDKKGFDLVIAEDFMSEAIFGFAQHFKAPLVLMSSMGGFQWANYAVGNTAPTSYIPNAMLSYTSRMTFGERLVNTMFNLLWDLGSELYYYPKQEGLKREFFGATLPYVKDLRKSASLVLVNNHFSLNYPRPLVPAFVEVGGMHVQPPQKPLPKDLQQWLDGAKEGAIYFSMGSNLKGNLLPAERRDALMHAFAALPQRVLMKWEDDSIPGQPKNVKLATWLPQQEILAHRNIKLFITHGGLLGAQEAMYHGVPLIGIPIFGDQHLNVNRAQQAGYGLRLDLNNITKESVSWAIATALSDKNMIAEAKRRSNVFHDQPETPLERAIFWVEYVMRHDGAKHLRSASLDLHWTQEALLDVYVTIFLILWVVVYLEYWLIKTLCCRNKKGENSKTEKHYVDQKGASSKNELAKKKKK